MTTIESPVNAQVRLQTSQEESLVRGLDKLGEIDLKAKIKTRLELNFLNAMIEVVDPNQNLLKTREKLKNGDFLVMYSNHTQHANMGGLRSVYRGLGNSRPMELNMAIAHSLANEGQDVKLIKFARAAAPILKRDGIQFIPLIRPQDLEKIAEENPNWRRDPQIKEKIREHSHNMKHIEKSFENPNAGFSFFFEATTEGGVLKGDGTHTGMIEVRHRMFADLIIAALKANRQVAFLPLGMVDFNKIVPPRTATYPKRVLWWGAKESFADHAGVYLGEKPAKVVVGEPFSLEDVGKDGFLVEGRKSWEPIGDQLAVNRYFAQKVTPLLPEDLQGVYKFNA